MSIKAKFSGALCNLLLLLIVFFPVFGQLSGKEKKEKEAERKQQLERKAYVLLNEIAGAAPDLKLPENRSFILAAAADLLWEHDEPRARNLFWDSLNTFNLMGTSIVPKSGSQIDKDTRRPTKEKEQTIKQYFAVFSLRQQLLQRVARRDPQLALD